MKTNWMLCLGLSGLLLSGCGEKKENSLSELQLSGNVESMRVRTYEAVEKFGEIEKGDLLVNDFHDNAFYEFNEDGMLTSLAFYDNYDDFREKTIFEYDKNLLMSVSNYDAKGNKNHKAVYTYEEGFMKTETVYDEDGVLDSRMVYKNDGRFVISGKRYMPKGDEPDSEIGFEDDEGYGAVDSVCTDDLLMDSAVAEVKEEPASDKKEKKVEKDPDQKEGEKLVYAYENTYQDDGKLVKSVGKNYYNGEVDYTSVTEYVWKGEWISQMKFDKDVVKFVRDDKGFITEIDGGIIAYGESIYPCLGEKYYYKYEFDDHGNWTKRTEYDGDAKQPKRITVRVISYAD